MRTGTTQVLPAADMVQALVLALFSSLLTFCLSAGSPELWVQVQMEAAELLSLSVCCGFLGSDLISLVTVSWGGPVDAGGTKLADLHPELGTHQCPDCQAHWETPKSISLTLTLGQSKARSPLTNTTFCCEFVIFPHGSSLACGDLHSSDLGFSAPILRADLAGILGTSGFLLFGFIFILCLLRRRKRWSFSQPQPSLANSQAQMQAQLLHLAPAHGSFISTENELYSGARETLPHTVPNILASTDHLEHSTLEN